MKTTFFFRLILRSFFVSLFLFFLVGLGQSFAQCPPNIDFENGDLTGWETLISGDAACVSGNPGTSISGSCSLPPSSTNILSSLTACLSLGMNTQIQTNTRVVVVPNPNVPAIDPYSGLPVVCPTMLNANNFSLKLGNEEVNDSAESVRIQFVVTNRISLTYRYAAVMSNPQTGHDFCTQPRLEFNIYDLGPVGNPYPNKIKDTCSSIFIPTPDANNLPAGWFASPVLFAGDPVSCSNWIPLTINLVSLLNHNIEIEFTTGDCSLGGHFGYAYIDIECNKFEIITKYCPGDTSATLYAPKGFANYIWDTLNTGAPAIAVGQDSIYISHPHDSLIYRVTIFPSTSNCAVDIYDTLRPVPKPTADFLLNPIPGCVGYPVNFIDTSKSNYKWSTVNHWNWVFGDKGTGLLDSSHLRFPSHTYNKPGTYYTLLTVKTDFQCLSDLKIKPIVVEQPNIILLDSVHPCYNSAYHLGFFSNDTIVGAHWYLKNNIGNLSCNDCFDPLYTTGQNNMVYVFYTDKHGCTNTDSIKIDLVDCPELVVPSAFSPNADGANDYFFILNRKFVTLNKFEVYNRWGEMLYSTTDLLAKGWDGTYKGKPQPQDVYVFQVVATDVNGNVKTLKGNVTLLR